MEEEIKNELLRVAATLEEFRQRVDNYKKSSNLDAQFGEEFNLTLQKIKEAKQSLATCFPKMNFEIPVELEYEPRG